MGIVHRVFVTLDCADPAPVGRFWADLLDGEIVGSNERYSIVRTDHVVVAAMRVPDHTPPTWPSNEVPTQVHLDLAVDDLEEAVAAAVRAGATEAGEQPAAERHRVLFDPAGHPFCLTTQAPKF